MRKRAGCPILVFFEGSVSRHMGCPIHETALPFHGWDSKNPHAGCRVPQSRKPGQQFPHITRNADPAITSPASANASPKYQ